MTNTNTKIIREHIESYKPSVWIQELFRILQSTYFYRWRSLARNRVEWLYIMREWENDLNDFTGEEISYALDRSKQRKNEKGELIIFPPTLSEFKYFSETRRKQKLQEEERQRISNVINLKEFNPDSDGYKQFREMCLRNAKVR